MKFKYKDFEFEGEPEEILKMFKEIWNMTLGMIE